MPNRALLRALLLTAISGQTSSTKDLFSVLTELWRHYSRSNRSVTDMNRATNGRQFSKNWVIDIDYHVVNLRLRIFHYVT